ncbi:hypothetical protein [Burkholderia sp. Ac-20365]|uniref:hypothetical protein n=1 Tax=Burkholderia sp. Ac-20365 TaxID=2703897 RepID=UPI00197C551A|nr:hypothetical protein [Burkholderia sp. Ac-20365]MBN3761347.1 hypothetical protein [Burkholderia sp. Ac-20365]
MSTNIANQMGGRGVERAAGKHQFEQTTLALRWYFGHRGRGGRIATFVCHTVMLTALTLFAATLAALGSVFLATILQINSDTRGVREHTLDLLTHTSALQYIAHIEAVLTSNLLSFLAASLLCAIVFEMAWTIKRARRLMPPVEFIARS